MLGLHRLQDQAGLPTAVDNHVHLLLRGVLSCFANSEQMLRSPSQTYQRLGICMRRTRMWNEVQLKGKPKDSHTDTARLSQAIPL